MNESGKSMKQTSVAMPESMHQSIEDRLDFGDYKAEWIREACRQRLQRESDSDDAPTQE